MSESMAQTLSEDLLYLIFRNCLPTILATIIRGSRAVYTLAPFNMSLVCRSWRAVALSRPNLWSSIEINQRSGYSHRIEVDLILEEWLRRSTSAPLDISYVIDASGSTTAGNRLPELIWGEVHRWKEMRLTAFYSSAIDPENPIVIRCLPQLESLDIYFLPSSLAILDISSYTATDNAEAKSQLRTLKVDAQMRWELPKRKRDLYFPALRTLSFCTDIGPTLDDTFALLVASPSLSQININILGVSPIAAHPSTPDQREAGEISLLDVKDINLLSWISGASRIILGRLSCPSLRTFVYVARYSMEELELQREDSLTINHLQSFNAFFCRSRSWSGKYPPLTTLSLTFGLRGIPRESYAELVQALKDLLCCLDTLEDLYLGDMVVDDELIQNLTLQTKDGEKDSRSVTLCPSLKDISIRCTQAYGMEKKTMEDMIVSRWRSTGTRLRSIRLTIPGFENFDTESSVVRKCVKEGLEWIAC